MSRNDWKLNLKSRDFEYQFLYEIHEMLKFYPTVLYNQIDDYPHIEMQKFDTTITIYLAHDFDNDDLTGFLIVKARGILGSAKMFDLNDPKSFEKCTEYFVQLIGGIRPGLYNDSQIILVVIASILSALVSMY